MSPIFARFSAASLSVAALAAVAALSGCSAATSSAGQTASTTVKTGPLGTLPVPEGAQPWKENTGQKLARTAFVHAFYEKDAWTLEDSLYKQRGFTGGTWEGWINADNSQQEISVIEFATEKGAASDLAGLTGTWKDQSAPNKTFKDDPDGATGLNDPTLDNLGNAYSEIAAKTGRYVVVITEFTAATPEPKLAVALLRQQLRSVQGYARTATQS